MDSSRPSTEPTKVHVQVTVGDYTESFWVDPLPDQLQVGTVENALTNGAISYGDVVEWNDDGQVVGIRGRSDRATLMCWIEADEEDLVTQAKWAQACGQAHKAWTARGFVVEGGRGLLIAAFPVKGHLPVQMQCLRLLEDLLDDAWELLWTVGPYPGMPTDPAVLELQVQREEREEDYPDVSLLERVSPRVVNDVAERDLITRLQRLGHVHADLDPDEVLAMAAYLADNDYLCYEDCLTGRTDMVVFRAGWMLCLQRGMLLPEVDPDELERDLLEG
jgi:hypothetical protein